MYLDTDDRHGSRICIRSTFYFATRVLLVEVEWPRGAVGFESHVLSELRVWRDCRTCERIDGVPASVLGCALLQYNVTTAKRHMSESSRVM